MARKRPPNWPPPVYDHPLPQRLRDIGAGLITIPPSEAVRHHYVPQFIMRRFATPEDAGCIFRLSKRSGRFDRVTIRAANQAEHLYGAETETGDYDNRVEGFLGLTEDAAAPALESLLSREALTEDVLLPLSLLFGLQQMRSPTALDAMGALIEKAAREDLERIADDPSAFAHLISLRRGEPVAPEDVEDERLLLLRLHQSGGGLRLAGQRNAGLEAMVDGYVEAGYALARADWHLLHAVRDSFVLNDVGYARFEERDALPVSRGLLFPLASDACLAVTPPGSDDTRVFRWACEPAEVSTINLRLYGWASEFIFGAAQHVVTTVRATAKSARSRSRPPSLDERAPGGP